MTLCPQRFRSLLGRSTAAWAALILACSASSTSPSLPTEFPGETTIPTSTPTPLALATPTPTRPPTASPEPTVVVDRVFIQLTDPLDEPEYYCVDVPGAGRGVRLQSALQAHTCKPIATAADELFTMDHPNGGQIYMKAYDLCVEAEEASTGSSLRLQPCSDSPLQHFAVNNNLIRLGDEGEDGLCLAVAPGSGIPTGGPSHLRRTLTLESCETVESRLSKWSLGLFDY